MPQYYTVKGGESWASIARDQLGNERAFADLMALNNAATLRPGMQIQLPGKVAETPFVSNELAAALGMATSGQVADWYANPANNPKFGMSAEWMSDQTQGATNQAWAYQHARGQADDLVRGRLPDTFQPGLAAGTRINQTNTSPGSRVALEYGPGSLGVPRDRAGNRVLENRRNNTQENQALAPQTQRPYPGMGESEARFSNRTMNNELLAARRRNELRLKAAQMGPFPTETSPLTEAQQAILRAQTWQAETTLSGLSGMPLWGSGDFIDDGTGVTPGVTPETTPEAGSAVPYDPISEEYRITQMWEGGIDWMSIQTGLDAQRNQPWIYQSPFTTYLPTGNGTYGSGSPGGQSYQYGLINFRMATG